MDFSNFETRKKTYGGANGNKISIMIDGELYMLKFPSASTRNKEISYLNGTISEYIGCHIFETFDIPVQKTILGTYRTFSGKEKIVVACKDFCENGYVLQDFASLKNQIIDSTHNGTSTELSSIIETIEKQTFFEQKKLKDFFWDLFIVDALIGNWDRHNGNWGFLYNATSDDIKIAPIFDCGSCLYPAADDESMKKILTNEDELKYRIFEIPTSALKIDNNRIRYYDFINSRQNSDCNNALRRIYPKIDLEKINQIIEQTPFLNNLQKHFFKTMVNARKNLILRPAFEKLKQIEKQKKTQLGIER